MDNNFTLMPDIVRSLNLSGDMLRVRVVICKQEEFDSSLSHHHAFEKLVDTPTLVIEWSRSLGSIKDELLVILLLAADEFNFNISNTVRRHPQIQSLYEKLKLRHEFTGRFKPITDLEEDMPCNGEGPWFLY